MKLSKTDKHHILHFAMKAGRKFPPSSIIFMCFCVLLAFPFVTPVRAQQNTASAFQDALTLSREGATDKAIEKMEEVVKNDPQNADAYEEVGYMLLKKGRFDDALSAFRSAVKINPRMRTARTGIGLTLYEKGNLDGAESALIEALSLNPYPSRAHYALGLVYEARKDYEKSIREYKEGLRTYKRGKK
jgi:tetratricopeptide (TPR) repeat protein